MIRERSNVYLRTKGPKMWYISLDTSLYTIYIKSEKYSTPAYHLTTPSLLNPSISASLIPSTSLNISSVCCPNIGGTLLILGLLSLYLTGVLTILIGPHASWSISTTIFLASTCWWRKVSLTSFTAAYGSPEPSKISSHSCVVFSLVMASMSASSSFRWATRCSLMSNFGSVFHSGR